jgi:hypothetical protein
MRIFISHATKEKPTIALPLYTQLKIHKLNPWIDQEDIALLHTRALTFIDLQHEDKNAYARISELQYLFDNVRFLNL